MKKVRLIEMRLKLLKLSKNESKIHQNDGAVLEFLGSDGTKYATFLVILSYHPNCSYFSVKLNGVQKVEKVVKIGKARGGGSNICKTRCFATQLLVMVLVGSVVYTTAKPLILQFVLRYARNHLPTM